MKIVEGRLPELVNHGFTLITDEYLKTQYLKAYGSFVDNELWHYRGSYVYNLGYSRRGQCYYILASDLGIEILATEPDGDGAGVILDNVFIELFNANLIETNE
jgi:hypothetical protein